MLKLLLNYIRTLYWFGFLFFKLVQRVLMVKPILKECDSYLKKIDLQLTEKQKKRIRVYLAISFLNNIWFYLLRGIKPNKTQLRAEWYIGAFTPIVDDMQDDEGYSFEQILDICFKKVPCKTANEHLLYYMWNELYTCTKNKEELVHWFKEVSKSQEESLKQINGALSKNELLRITFKKGADATYFYQTIQNIIPEQDEKEAIFHLGGTLQLINDIFDIHKDNAENLQTPALVISDMYEYEKLLKTSIIDVLQRFSRLNYSTNAILKLKITALSVLSRGLVCTNQFKKLQDRNNGVFDVNAFKRDDLICDMEKLSNIFKSIYYTAMHISV